MIAELKGIEWREGAFGFIDQTLLPHEERWIWTTDWREIVAAIKRLGIRGAPAIGVSGAFACYLTWEACGGEIDAWNAHAEEIANARPTAVNLVHCVNRVQTVVQKSKNLAEISELLLKEALMIAEEDEKMCLQMAEHGSGLFSKKMRILTHCNTGALVTYGIGTALGVVRRGFEKGLVDHVFACEARPLGQGSRLTMWELEKLGIPATLLCDSAAGRLMQSGSVDCVIVGADRIAANGDTANKVGTLNLAIIANRFGIPFYIAAPSTTFDSNTSSGEAIEVELRSADEVRYCNGQLGTVKGADAFNPAFDVTPADLITAFVCENGVLYPPFKF